MAVNTDDVGSALQLLASALLGDVEQIAERSVARMQELLPSYARVPRDALIPITLANIRNLLEAIRDPGADRVGEQHAHYASGGTRARQGITSDEMLHGWRIGLEVVREESYAVAEELELGKDALLGFVDATLRWGDIGMRASASAHHEAEIREFGRLVEEQAVLRRVATLVARGAEPEEVFAAAVEEVGRLLVVDLVSMGRYEPNRTMTFVASWGRSVDFVPIGSRLTLGGKNLNTIVFETGRPARIDSYADASGPIGLAVRDGGVRSAAGTPIVVEDRLWGMMAAGSSGAEPLPADTEARLASFTELLAMAIANTESRAALAASRARVVAASDETRRRIERDLHDRAQQRLVSLGLEVRAVQAAVPPQLGELERDLSRVAEGLASVFDELREISQGIHPAILSEGGLGPALRALARRSPVPVELDLRAERRLPEPFEAAVYYVICEALTNAAKHAQASKVHIELEAHAAIVRFAIRDDGIGGADPAQGSGLVGLSDRIEALGGMLQVASPTGNGTTLLVEIPLDGQSHAARPAP